MFRRFDASHRGDGKTSGLDTLNIKGIAIRPHFDDPRFAIDGNSCLGPGTANIGTAMDHVSGVASAITEQNAVSAEISANMQSAATAVSEINDRLGHLRETFVQVTAASERVKGNVEALIA